MTTQLDLNALASAYEQISIFSAKRLIARYVLRDDKPETITTATQVIQKLLSNYSQLRATFPTQPQDNLEKEITEKKFLVINGDVICLSDENKAPASAPQDFVDRFFSRSLLKQPVACTKNHYLELTYLPFWVVKHGNVCPGGNHKIVSTETDTPLNDQYPFEIDKELQWNINEFRKENLARERQDQEQAQRIETLEKDDQEQAQRIHIQAQRIETLEKDDQEQAQRIHIQAQRIETLEKDDQEQAQRIETLEKDIPLFQERMRSTSFFLTKCIEALLTRLANRDTLKVVAFLVLLLSVLGIAHRFFNQDVLKNSTLLSILNLYKNRNTSLPRIEFPEKNHWQEIEAK